MAEDEKSDRFAFDWTSAYLGFCVGMVVVILMDNARNRRDKEKIRRHLERALEEVED